MQVQLTRGDSEPAARGGDAPRVGCLHAVCADGVVLGWAVDPDEPARRVEVELHLDGPAGTGAPLGSAVADRPCPELDPSGSAADSQRGFVFRLPDHLRDDDDHVLHACVRGRDGVARALTRGPLAFRLSRAGQPAPRVEGRLQTGREARAGYASGHAREARRRGRRGGALPRRASPADPGPQERALAPADQ